MAKEYIERGALIARYDAAHAGGGTRRTYAGGNRPK